MRILLSKFNMIGDVVLATPLLESLRKSYPDARITFATYESCADAIRHHPALDRLVLMPRRRGLHALLDNLRFFGWFLLHAQDLYICLRDNNRGRWLGWLARARVRISVQPNLILANRLAYTHRRSHPHAHAVENDLFALRSLGLEPCTRQPSIHWSTEDEARVLPLLPEGDFVMIHPVARWSYKELAPEKVARIADAILTRGIPVVFTCSPDPREKGKLVEIQHAMTGKALDLGGRLSLPQLAFLASRARLFVGCDTAAMHIATAVKTPVVAWFGPSRTRTWGPWDALAWPASYEDRGGVQHLGRHCVIASKMDCVPCGLAGCEGRGESRCLAEMDTGEIIAQILPRL
ncbi:MAG: glycosyltransferase family 9 protein [Planctomycetes bacterium]|nr:glycosyltransferase family 9 protein [Planctomycetota bacterium]